MPQVSLDCPHCLTSKSGFTLRGGYQNGHAHLTDTGILFFSCNTCQDAVVARAKHPAMSSWIAGSSIDLPKILFVWPQPKPLALPLHLPDNVSRYFLQAQDNLARQAWDAAGGMFRKSLDTGLIKLNLGPARGNLKSRIDQMPESSGVTPAMKEWAHEVRLLGNDAMHDDEPFSEPDAKALASFTEMFLTYAFSLPGMLAERRLQTQPGGRSESRSKIMLSFDRGVAA